MDKRTENIIAVLLILILSNESYAQKVLPEFTGEWFDEATINTVDSCNVVHYNYKNKSKNKDEIIHKIHAELAHSTGLECKLKSIETVPGPGSDLPDFPASPLDLDEIVLKNPLAPRKEYLNFSCQDNAGHVRSEGRFIYPSYNCPVGSRSFVGRENIFDRHCSSPPLVCMADVVGRNLKIFLFGELGHVGITTNFVYGRYGNYVVEVLGDNEKVISVNTLKSFEEARPGEFWGEVYDLPKVKIDWIRANNIISAGIRQQVFQPIYTITSLWQEGRNASLQVYDEIQNTFKNENKIINAIFRCDTFVYYAYLKSGINITLLGMFPRTVFNSFLNKRMDVPSQKSRANNDVKQVDNWLDQPLNKNNLMDFDEAMQNYLKSSKYTHSEKIKNLINQLKIEKEGLKYSYILDILGFLSPIEAVPNLINEYNTQQNVEHKKRLIYTILRATEVTQLKNVEQSYIDNIKLAQHWILQVLHTEKTPILLNEAIFDAINMLPITKENYGFIVEAMNSLESLSNTILDLDKKYLYLLEMAFANADMQKWLLPRLLATSRTHADKLAFENRLYFFMKELSPDRIEKEARESIAKYLKSYVDNSKKITYDHFYTFLTVNSISEKDRNNKLLRQLLKIKQSKLQAEVIVNLDEKLILQLPIQERKKLQQKYFELSNYPNNITNQYTYGLAFSKLLSMNKS